MVTAADIAKTIARSGSSVTFINPNLSAGAEPWQVTDGADIETAAVARISPVSEDLVDGSAIVATDLSARIAESEVPAGLDITWRVRDGSVEYAITAIVKRRFGGAIVSREIVFNR